MVFLAADFQRFYIEVESSTETLSPLYGSCDQLTSSESDACCLDGEEKRNDRWLLCLKLLAANHWKMYRRLLFWKSLSLNELFHSDCLSTPASLILHRSVEPVRPVSSSSPPPPSLLAILCSRVPVVEFPVHLQSWNIAKVPLDLGKLTWEDWLSLWGRERGGTYRGHVPLS